MYVHDQISPNLVLALRPYKPDAIIQDGVESETGLADCKAVFDHRPTGSPRVILSNTNRNPRMATTIAQFWCVEALEGGCVRLHEDSDAALGVLNGHMMRWRC